MSQTAAHLGSHACAATLQIPHTHTRTHTLSVSCPKAQSERPQVTLTFVCHPGPHASRRWRPSAPDYPSPPAALDHAAAAARAALRRCSLRRGRLRPKLSPIPGACTPHHLTRCDAALHPCSPARLLPDPPVFDAPVTEPSAQRPSSPMQHLPQARLLSQLPAHSPTPRPHHFANKQALQRPTPRLPKTGPCGSLCARVPATAPASLHDIGACYWLRVSVSIGPTHPPSTTPSWHPATSAPAQSTRAPANAAL